jgi:phage/plasmid primase-like uncharacterized protein
MTGHDWQAVKSQFPIAEVIGQAIALKKHGKEYKGCCPFHAEKTPSFTVVPDREFFHCFGCGASGDVIDFIAKHNGTDQSGAIAILTNGSSLEMSDDDKRKRRDIMAQREAAHAQEEADAIRRARSRWEASTECESHRYLKKKGIEAHVARIEGDNLILPIYGPDGEICSVQTINDDGKTKRFQYRAPTKGGRLNIGLHLGRTIVCEGFATGASIHDAVPDQVCITFSKGNMAVVARELASQNVPIVLAADLNAAAEMTALAKELDCPVAIPTDKDFNDQAQSQGVESVAITFNLALRAYAAAKKRADDEAKAETAPLDLWARYTPPSLPKGVLPKIIEDFANARALQMGVDPGGLAMSALTACASVIKDSIRLKVKQHEKWTESARIWTMLIGDPSYKKSPIMRAATGKIKSLDADLLYAGNKAMMDWQEGGGSKSGQSMPQCPRLRVEDITMEAAQEVCRHSPEGIMCLQDELSGWFGGIEKYSGGKGSAKDRSFWLTAFGGGQYAVNRVGRGSYIIDNLSVTILGGVQPDPIRRIVADATDDGLIQRFFPIILQPASVGKDEEVGEIAYEYDAMVERLNDLVAPENVTGKMALQFDDGARRIRSELERKHHKLVTATEGFNKKLAAHIGKFDGLFPRLCIIWHCIENRDAPDGLPIFVSESTASRVADFLSNYIMRHSLAFYAGIIGLADDHDALQDVAGYILANKLDSVTMRTLSRGSRAMRKITRDEGARIFEQLEAMGWLEQIHKRSDAPSWKVNPEVHIVFEAKADEERLRRNEARQAIASMIEGDED